MPCDACLQLNQAFGNLICSCLLVPSHAVASKQISVPHGRWRLRVSKQQVDGGQSIRQLHSLASDADVVF